MRPVPPDTAQVRMDGSHQPVVRAIALAITPVALVAAFVEWLL